MKLPLAAVIVEAATDILGEDAVILEPTTAPGQLAPRSALVQAVGARGWSHVDSVSGYPLRVEDQVLCVNPNDLPFPVRNGLLVDYRGRAWTVTDHRTDSQLGMQLRLKCRS